MDLEASKHLGILPRQRRIIQQVAIILVQVLEIFVQATLARSMEEVTELSPRLKVASKLMSAYQQVVLLAQRRTLRDHPRSRQARRAILMVTERTVIETTIIRVALQPMATSIQSNLSILSAFHNVPAECATRDRFTHSLPNR